MAHAIGGLCHLFSCNISSNSGHNYGGGASIGFGQQSGVSFQLSSGQSAGKANGTETTCDNTLIEASNSLKISWGRDTTFSGAQLKGKQVDANIGHNLTITTLKDCFQYDSKQSSSGLSISLCIPLDLLRPDGHCQRLAHA